jgi:protoporphyrinogen oxidase
MSIYDYTIIGAGPSGLITAYLLAKSGKKCILIDKNDNIGGCHRVLRIDGLFTEHGPRIYSSSYLNTINILNDMGINFYDIFTEYNFSISNIGGKSIKNLSFKELLILGWNFLINSKNTQIISMTDFMEKHNFSTNSKDYINRLCLLTDGASADKYTLFEFLELANQQILYKLYQPKKPNDKLLFPLMLKSLMSTNNVEIMLNTEVLKLNRLDNNIISIDTNKGIIQSTNYILAVCPKDIFNILSINSLQDNFGPNLKLITENNSYNNYISIIFHFNTKLNLENIWGFPKSEWGIAFIILSNYMDFEDSRSQTVISTCITLPNIISSFSKKTANQTENKEELINEVFRQLSETFKNIPKPTYSLLSPNVYRYNSTWLDTDSAYIKTDNNLYLENKGEISNLYNVGTHNGYSPYHFTSFESAVANSLHFVRGINSEIKRKYYMKYPSSLRNIIRIILFFIILIFIILII